MIDHILAAYRSRLLELWTRPVDFVSRSNPHPRASKLARWQAERSANVTTLRHELYNLTEPGRAIMRMLDGTRDIPALHRVMASIAAPNEIDRLLQTFADESLLMADA